MRTLILLVILGICGVWIYIYPPGWVTDPSWLNSLPYGSDVLAYFQPPKKVWLPPSPDTVYPTEWVTTDGKRYHHVKVVSVDADAVSILHSDGVSLVETSNLSSDLKKLVNYDPDLAAEAAALRREKENKDDQDFSAALQQKANQGQTNSTP